MTKSVQLKAIITALGGTPTAGSNADLIGQIAALMGATVVEGTNADMLALIVENASNVFIGEGQVKQVSPTTVNQNIRADTGKVLTRVHLLAVTSSIDANIVAENIKSGVTILGVEGTYTGV